MIIWIVIENEHETGSGAIKGLFNNENQAKLFLADYALKNEFDTSFLELVERKVEVTLNE